MNRLSKESSPYLLQHAHNPVDWYPWGEEALNRSVQENKLMIISIGYSSCHWCHVMEKETFADTMVAEMMNRDFISVKVDREERPDLDQVFMDAVQMMGRPGGWPLNVFALPGGKPFWGGTYFPKESWLDTMARVVEIYRNRPKELVYNSEQVMEALQRELPFDFQSRLGDIRTLSQAVYQWKTSFDKVNGGFKGAPKFPLPVNLLFLLDYYHHTQEREIWDFVEHTLVKMASGGIYDQLGGGFARYSTDEEWRVPHFEKMLYDNALLVQLYATAFRVTPHPLFRRVVSETVDFLEREMTGPGGCFFSALDADSEGVEGRYYAWTEAEVREILGHQAEMLMSHFGITREGNWEEGRNILYVRDPLPSSEIDPELEQGRIKLMAARESRIRPFLDIKVLTSWNALMVQALFQAYNVFGEDRFLRLGKRALDELLARHIGEDGALNRSRQEGKPGIPGFLDDYAHLIMALLMYPGSNPYPYYEKARGLCELVLRGFKDSSTGLFFYTKDTGTGWPVRRKEVLDNVMPSSNAMMVRALHRAGHLFEDEEYLKASRRMITLMEERILAFPGAHGMWATAFLEHRLPFYTLVITGPDAGEQRKLLSKQPMPDVWITVVEEESEIPLFRNRHSGSETRFFLCSGKECFAPVSTVEDVTAQVQRLRQSSDASSIISR